MQQTIEQIDQIVIYKRLSTKRERQTSSFEVQDDYINMFIAQHAPNAKVLAVFEEERSGSDGNRPMAKEAEALCRKTGATLVVAKLDRLSRDVAYIAELIKHVRLKVAVMPFATELELHIYATLAQQELKMIRERVKDGVRKAKERGKRVGHPDAANHMRNNVAAAGRKAQSSAANQRAEAMRKTLTMAVRAKYTLQEIANDLNDEGKHLTARGGKWTATAVRRMMVRLGLPTNASQAAA